MSAAALTDESASFLKLMNNGSPPVTEWTVADRRRASEELAATYKGDSVFGGTTDKMVVECEGYKLPVYVLRPSAAKLDHILVYFHGGGWVCSSAMTHMSTCEMIAQTCNCVVVNVDYRLAPEHKFPACYEDAENVVNWCLQNKQKLAGNEQVLLGVGGDSAGGNIAASVCHIVTGIDYQVLIYPSLNMAAKDYPSYSKYGEGLLLTVPLMNWFRGHFFNTADDALSELSSPMLRHSFTSLPPALFVVAECDPLADQSSAYKEKLDAAGVKTEFVMMKGTVHSYINKPGHFKDTTRASWEHIKNFLNQL